MKKSLKIFSLCFLLFGIILNSSLVLANEHEELTPILISQPQEPKDAGITPDSFLWGIDKAFEQIALLLTTTPEGKSAKGLEIASERLAEIKVMIEENKLEKAEKAKESHGKTLIKVKAKIKEIEKDDSEEEIKEVIEIENKLGEHDKEVENVFGELKIKIKVEGDLTQEQQNLIDSLLASLQGQTGEIKIEIKNKKDETKIKIKQETGKSDIEIEQDIKKIEIELGVAGVVVRAKIIGSQSEVKIEKKFSTTTTDRNRIIDEIIAEFALDRELVEVALETKIGEGELEEKFKVEAEVKEGVTKVEVKLRFILNTADREEILNAVVERSQLTKGDIESVIKFEDEKEEQELEIEVEVENGIAKVKVELAGEDLKFTLETTDKEEIISEIVKRTSLTREEIESVMDFKIEDEEDSDDDEDEDEEKN